MEELLKGTLGEVGRDVPCPVARAWRAVPAASSELTAALSRSWRLNIESEARWTRRGACSTDEGREGLIKERRRRGWVGRMIGMGSRAARGFPRSGSVNNDSQFPSRRCSILSQRLVSGTRAIIEAWATGRRPWSRWASLSQGPRSQRKTGPS